MTTQKHTLPYASWDDVAAAVEDARMNAEGGGAGPMHLEYFFQKHGLVVLYHVDMTEDAVTLAALAKPTPREVSSRDGSPGSGSGIG